MTDQKVLVIDDQPAVGQAIDLLLQLHDIDCTVVYTPQAGIAIIEQDPSIQLVIQDMNFRADTTSGEEGQILFRELKKRRSELPVILITAWTQLETAVQLVKEGASDYLAKPWDDQKLVTTVLRILELQQLRSQEKQRQEKRILSRQQLAQSANLCGMIYDSDQTHDVVAMAVKIARTDVPVLITGPNGAGKEKIAHILQKNSDRQAQPFICVNVGALANELIEAELFGAEAGAYTGNNKTRIGRFESANNGTLFLDEIGNLSAKGQAKLLRVLQTGEFERLGSSKTRHCNVRVISATNEDLSTAITEGRFREDLFYRLNVIELTLPPLSQRKEDILPLLTHFLGKSININSSIIQSLQQYSWPGNVRELENACKRASIMMTDNSPSIEDFGLTVEQAQSPTKLKCVVEPSREMIEQALTANNGVVARAARQLGMSRQSLYRRMEQYDIHST